MKKGLRENIQDWAEVFLQSLVIIVLLFMFIGRNSEVSGTSMVPTLHNKDMLIISNLFYTPQRRDIIVFIKEEFKPEALVKRVIALEGETVDVDYENNCVLALALGWSYCCCFRVHRCDCFVLGWQSGGPSRYFVARCFQPEQAVRKGRECAGLRSHLAGSSKSPRSRKTLPPHQRGRLRPYPDQPASFS